MKNLTSHDANRTLQRRLATACVPLLLSAAPALVACGAESDLPIENLGNTSDSLGGSAAPPSASNLTGKARLNGRWVGQPREPLVEVDGEPSSYVFPSGSRDVALELEFDGDSFVSGSLVFGAGTPPTPLAGIRHPSGVEYGLSVSVNVPVIEGFVYPLSAAPSHFEENTPVTAIVSYERLGGFADWCPLQPTFSASGGRFQCIEGEGGWGGRLEEQGYVCTSTGADGSEIPVDCGLATLCALYGACECDAAGCVHSPETALIWLTLEGDELRVGFGSTWVDVGLPAREPEELNLVRMSRVAAP